MDSQNKPDLAWEYRVPFTNIYTLWDWLRLFLAIIASMFAMAAYESAVTHDPAFAFLLWGTISLFVLPILGLSILVVVVFYRHGIQMIFTIDKWGIQYQGGPAAKKLATMGLVTGLATGYLAMIPISSSMRGVSMDWEGIKKATVDQSRHVISLHDMWHTKLRLYCDAEIFKKALTLIEQHSVKISTRTLVFK